MLQLSQAPVQFRDPESRPVRAFPRVQSSVTNHLARPIRDLPAVAKGKTILDG